MNIPDLIEQAVNDLELCERDPRYVIDMSKWHTPRGEVCAVCLAGSLLAQTYKYDNDEYLLGSKWDKLDRDVRLQLYALNALRLGDLENAAATLGQPLPSGMGDRVMPEYRDDPEAFKAALRQLATDWRAATV